MKINDYANSMFRFEFLHSDWIEDCKNYLDSFAQKYIHEAVCIDYAFGRGNWSLALKLAGARKVIAIDASIDNCNRFESWLKSQGIKGIDVVHANILEDSLDIKADFIWAHGILHHVAFPTQLVSRLSKLMHPQSFLHLYAYNDGCLRQSIINPIRSVLRYETECEFRNEAPLFGIKARMRVRDDLTAPYVHWLSGEQMHSFAESCGLRVVKQHIDFSDWHKKVTDEEFCPHNYIYSFSEAPILNTDAFHHRSITDIDIKVIAELMDILFKSKSIPTSELKNIAIGICNSHFSSLHYGGVREALTQDFLHLLYIIASRDLFDLYADNEFISYFLDLAMFSLTGQTEVHHKGCIDSYLSRYLRKHRIRI